MGMMIIISTEIALELGILIFRQTHVSMWRFLKLGDPQVTMGFNTQMLWLGWFGYHDVGNFHGFPYNQRHFSNTKMLFDIAGLHPSGNRLRQNSTWVVRHFILRRPWGWEPKMLDVMGLVMASPCAFFRKIETKHKIRSRLSTIDVMHFPQSSNMQSIVRAAVLNKILTTPLESPAICWVEPHLVTGKSGLQRCCLWFDHPSTKGMFWYFVSADQRFLSLN